MTQQQAKSAGGRKPSSTVYWMRFGFAIAAGFANYAFGINEANFDGLAFPLAIGLGGAFYLASVMVVRHVLHYGEAELKGKNRAITLGGGTFIMVWIMIAVLLNTLGV